MVCPGQVLQASLWVGQGAEQSESPAKGELELSTVQWGCGARPTPGMV